ncbi:MAG: putative membrane protein YeaQ/YmgE (transglycosylase-associated protein family) [Verrucomicrobiales bacterium]|jgi:uncharacterized membrane protein YeaQ/YmgE (transglycosylase-associated protein family)
MWGIITAVILGTIIGYGGRAILPGGQDIGLPKTIGLGVVSSFVVSLATSTTSFFVQVILGSLVAAGLLWLAIKKGWLASSS